MSKLVNVGQIAIKNSSLFICDIQEKFRNTISHFPEMIVGAQRLLKASEILEIPVVVTEQYPKGRRRLICILIDNNMSVYAYLLR